MTEPHFDKAANTGVRHLINATRFSWRGLVAAIKGEAAFRQELAMILVLIPTGIWIAESLLDFALLLTVCLLVLVVELLNSAIEATLDRVGEEHHRLTGLAKDYGSAAVMVTLAMALIVWTAMLITRLTQL